MAVRDAAKKQMAIMQSLNSQFKQRKQKSEDKTPASFQ